MTEWLKRTNTGRVVYQRPVNTFKYSSVARILRNMSLSYDGNDIDNVFLVLFYSIDNLASRIYEEVLFQWDLVFAKLAGLSTGQRLLLKLVRAWIDLDRRWRADHGIISLPWIPKAKSFLFPWNPEDFKPTQQLPPGADDPFLPDLLQARGDLTEYLMEVGYGESER